MNAGEYIDRVKTQLDAARQENQVLRAALEKAKWDLVATCILVSYGKGDDGAKELVHYVRQIEAVVIPARKAIEEVLGNQNEV